ncbi:hypothetical protein TREES_T100003936 [Tupaia chinensis]|uniref:DUF4706 domain-containing protein n=1 Tax=Tupaia chinensis TaxID=246437 RepID=L9KYY4_TUPCH|nr:hypothetical protein TREES_T100003936 [Tupaia chinensis]
MAAAIAPLRLAVMSGNRPLDDRERKRFTYFSSLSPMARKIMQDKEKIREKYGPEWARLPPAQQDEIIDRFLGLPTGPGLVNLQSRFLVPARAALQKEDEQLNREPEPPGDPGASVLLGAQHVTGLDVEASGAMQSQMEFSICALSIQDPGNGTAASEPRPLSKAPQGPQALKASQGSRSSSLDALGPARKDEEASFWKINAERSRGEGSEAEFQSLTPSQIKSMEKGEKVLPACYRPEPAPKDREAKVDKPSTLRQEQRTLLGVSQSGERERPQPAQASPCSSHEAAPSEPARKLLSFEDTQGDEDDALFMEPKPAQGGSGGEKAELALSRHLQALRLAVFLSPRVAAIARPWQDTIRSSAPVPPVLSCMPLGRAGPCGGLGSGRLALLSTARVLARHDLVTGRRGGRFLSPRAHLLGRQLQGARSTLLLSTLQSDPAEAPLLLSSPPAGLQVLTAERRTEDRTGPYSSEKPSLHPPSRVARPGASALPLSQLRWVVAPGPPQLPVCPGLKPFPKTQSYGTLEDGGPGWSATFDPGRWPRAALVPPSPLALEQPFLDGTTCGPEAVESTRNPSCAFPILACGDTGGMRTEDTVQR